jgi:aromatic-L-amino-acid/L-tryptophan decarboxylase
MIVERPPTGVNGPRDASSTPAGPGTPGPAHPLALGADAMRALGYRAVDALVDRWMNLEESAPWAGADRDGVDAELADLLGPPSELPGMPDAVLDEAIERILPLAARVDHPRFMAYIPSAPTWPSVMADLLASGFNTFQGTWQGSAGPSRIELEVVDWFRTWLGMPAGSSGVFTSGGSMANALALVAAREAAADRARRAGVAFRPSVILSDQGHASLVRAARLAGVSDEGVRVLATGTDLRLDPSDVRGALEADRAAGWTPILVAANAGATSTGIVDPLGALARVCRDQEVHFHVDAAYGGFAVLDAEGAALLEGIDAADSVTLDPHKWLFQPFACGCLVVRDPAFLTRAFRMAPEYMQDTALGDPQVNFSDRGVELTRPFRALKVWMSVRSFGLGAFREAVGTGLRLAAHAERRIRDSDALEVVTPAALGIVTWRARGQGEDEALHVRIRDVLAAGNVAFLSSTRIHGEHALRFCILNPALTAADVDRAVAAAEAVVRGSRGGVDDVGGEPERPA